MNMRSLRNSRNAKSLKKMALDTETEKEGKTGTNKVRMSLNKSMTGRKSEIGNQTVNNSLFSSPMKSSSNKKGRESPFDITEDEMNRIKKKSLNEKA